VRALILDSGLDRGSLAAARALHDDGWEVGIGSPVRGLAGCSRAVSAWHPVPPPGDGAEAFLAAAADAIAQGGYEIVFSSDDHGVLLLSEHRARVAATVPYAPHERVVTAFDKLALTRAAVRAGLAVPRTEQATDAVLAGWSGPAVVKPRLTFSAASAHRIDAQVLAGPDDARRRAAEVRRSGGEPIVQELIDGGLMALSVVCDRDSRVVAAVQQESPHTWPPRVGVSARARTVPLDATLKGGVQELLSRLGWFGLAQLQFLRQAGEQPRLLEINGRFYGSLALAVRAGVNLPAVWARLATDRPIGPAYQARVGQVYQWLSRDLRWAVRSADGRPGAALPRVAETLATALTSAHSVWSLRDPAPALRHYGGQLRERWTPRR
jgi:predicted ATP-grasp superfamily ATP-dependent carboligase